MRIFIALALALFCAKSFAAAPAKVLSESERPVYINAKRADFLAAKLESDLRRAGAEGRIPRRDAVLYAIGQFLFCIDIAACILLYLRVRGKRLPAERVDVRPAEEQPEGQGNKL